MALLKCPECSRSFSDYAESCPGCGIPTHVALDLARGPIADGDAPPDALATWMEQVDLATAFVMVIEDVLDLDSHLGTAAVGRILAGILHVGDHVDILGTTPPVAAEVAAIEVGGRLLNNASKPERVRVFFDTLDDRARIGVAVVRGTPRVDDRAAQGIVKWFDPAEGFGFILPTGGGPDVFVHHSAIEGSGSLVQGERVIFDIFTGTHGPIAERVRTG